MNKKTILWTVAGVGFAAFLSSMLPSIKRYIRIYNM